MQPWADTLLGVKHHTGAWRHICVGKGEAAVSSAPLALCPSLAAAQQLSRTWICEVAQVLKTHRGESVFLQLFGIVYVFRSLCLTVQTGIVTRKGKKTPLNAKVCVGEIGTGVTTELGLEASSAEHTKSSESFTYGSKITNTRLEKVTWIEKLWTCSLSLLASCQFSPFNVYIMCALTLQGCGYFPPTDSWKRIFLQ